MPIRLIGLVMIVLLTAIAPPALSQTAFRPVAIVNDSAITGYDLSQRARILAALGFNSQNQDALQREALEQLVTDRLKLQEGRRVGLTPTPETIEIGLAEFAQRAGLAPDEFLVLLSNQGVNRQAINDMVAAEVIWIRVVQGKFAGRVEPGEAEIESELELIKNRGGFEFRLLEIGLPLTDGGRTEAQTQALALELYDQLIAGGDFDAAVREYSRAPSAQRGGDVGWVSTSRMSANVLRGIADLEVGQVSRPIPVSGGVSIVKLADRRAARQPETDDPELRQRVRERLINQRTARLAEGLLQEMRRDALIELR